MLAGTGIRTLFRRTLLVLGLSSALAAPLAGTTPQSLAPYLANKPKSGPFTPPRPRYELEADLTHFVTMRDGVRLAFDLYRPRGLQRAPVILIRTPYNRRGWRPGGQLHQLAQILVGGGYHVVVQDVRGKFDSEGVFAPAFMDDLDAYDTIDWLVKQDFATPDVGMFGCSYLGETQITAARSRHPALKAIIPQAAGGALGAVDGRYRYAGARNFGAAELIMSVGWFRGAGSTYNYKPPVRLSRQEFRRIEDKYIVTPIIPDANTGELARQLPTISILDNAGVAPSEYSNYISKSSTDSYWDRFAYLRDGDRVDVPSLHENGWYDYGVAETLLIRNFFEKNSVSERSVRNQFAFIHPNTHCRQYFMTEDTKVADRSVGDARFNIAQLYLDWFDHWLKGEDRGIDRLPRLIYYVMGREEWRGADQWPLPETQFTRFYLDSGGDSRSRQGNGRLTLEQPRRTSAQAYVFDPMNPVPSLGGPLCCTGLPTAPEGAYDQSEIQLRPDVLVYTSEPLAEGLEITGPLKLVLYVSSDAPDTDFTAKLSDVYPDGRAFNVQEGILRARYREGLDRQVMMRRGGVYRLEIDIQATSNYFRPGHRIRLEVSSSNFPRFDRNSNTGGDIVTESVLRPARNQVHHGGVRASYLLLPVIPAQPGRTASR